MSTIITAEEARNFISEVAPSLGYDFTYQPAFPRGRQDVCAVIHAAENGNDFGYSLIYLVWKNAAGEIRYEELDNTRSSKDYINFKAIKANGNKVTVSYGSGGSFSGESWERTKTNKI